MENHIICKICKHTWLASIAIITTTTNAAIVINEIDYDQPGSDIAEFVELFNPGSASVLLDGYSLELINGSSGDVYRSLDLSGSTIAANSYLVLCGDTTAVRNCSIDIASRSWIQNGGQSGDAIALLFGGALIDSIVYEASGHFPGNYSEGSGLTNADSNSILMSIGRLPDGLDSNNNASDFGSNCLTPGSANIGGTGDCSISMSPVPVPAAVWLLGTGLIGMLGVGRRKSMQ